MVAGNVCTIVSQWVSQPLSRQSRNRRFVNSVEVPRSSSNSRKALEAVADGSASRDQICHLPDGHRYLSCCCQLSSPYLSLLNPEESGFLIVCDPTCASHYERFLVIRRYGKLPAQDSKLLLMSTGLSLLSMSL